MTNWRKNLDSAFISGEDLKMSLNGLLPEMVVFLMEQKDAQTFDQNKQAKVTVTGLYFKDQSGKQLYKPAILNKTNARFFEKEFNSSEMEDWYGKPVVMFAKPDSRHGQVVRFKTYVLPELKPGTENFEKCKTALKSGGFTIDKIKLKYRVSSEVEKLLTAE